MRKNPITLENKSLIVDISKLLFVSSDKIANNAVSIKLIILPETIPVKAPIKQARNIRPIALRTNNCNSAKPIIICFIVSIIFLVFYLTNI